LWKMLGLGRVEEGEVGGGRGWRRMEEEEDGGGGGWRRIIVEDAGAGEGGGGWRRRMEEDHCGRCWGWGGLKLLKTKFWNLEASYELHKFCIARNEPRCRKWEVSYELPKLLKSKL
jgi:hypothetical protein